jgi:hypothetical protein
MGNRSPYETYRTGHWSLLGIVAVTAINIVLASFSVTLYFPFSACIPRELILWGQTAGGSWVPLTIVFAAAFFFCYLACELLTLRQEKLPAFRLALALYALDSGVYLAFALPEITQNGFGIMSITEVLLRWFALAALYRADKVWNDPGRKNPTFRTEQPVKKEKTKPEPTEEDEEDEGIQW